MVGYWLVVNGHVSTIGNIYRPTCPLCSVTVLWPLISVIDIIFIVCNFVLLLLLLLLLIFMKIISISSSLTVSLFAIVSSYFISDNIFEYSATNFDREPFSSSFSCLTFPFSGLTFKFFSRCAFGFSWVKHMDRSPFFFTFNQSIVWMKYVTMDDSRR